jgi:hypothetical protein
MNEIATLTYGLAVCGLLLALHAVWTSAPSMRFTSHKYKLQLLPFWKYRKDWDKDERNEAF